MSPRPLRVLFFDVFGTVVEWRWSVTRQCIEAAKRALNDPENNLTPREREDASAMTPEDWQRLTEEWRASYYQFTRNFDPSGDFNTVDQHYYISLGQLLEKRSLGALFTEAEKWDLTQSWHRLDPWPDSVEGLRQLNRRFRTSTLSNGNISLLEDLRDYAGLPFTDIVSAEHFGAYKPSPEVYLGAARRLGVEPTECGLVAAHLNDLEAAKGVGFQTIYVQREGEERQAMVQQEYVDVWVNQDFGGLEEVGRRLG